MLLGGLEAAELLLGSDGRGKERWRQGFRELV